MIYISSFISVQSQQISDEKLNSINTSYLESKNELNDYILDTGDVLSIQFKNAPTLSGKFKVDEQGEIYLERIKYAYVRGLTIKELTKLLEKRYEEFMLNANIYIKIASFKPIRVAIKGQIRSPGIIKFPAYISTNIKTILNTSETKNLNPSINKTTGSSESNLFLSSKNKFINEDSSNIPSNSIKRDNDYITTLSNAILYAFGITSYSDLSNIKIIRDIPIGKGGGKKRAIINFLPYIKNADTTRDIRLFDGDSIFIPSLKVKDPSIIPNSILSGLTPKFISVRISGQIENPGVIKIPIEGSLSDLINLTGPRKPLSGGIYLLRYNQDGTILRKNIKYSSSARAGSYKNPYLFGGDSIHVKNSILGKTSATLKAVTEPFIGIYATKEIIQAF